MDRIKEIETWLENQKMIKTLANKPVYADDIKSPLDTPLSHIEYLLAENKRLQDELSKKSRLLRMFINEEEESRITKELGMG